MYPEPTGLPIKTQTNFPVESTLKLNDLALLFSSLKDIVIRIYAIFKQHSLLTLNQILATSIIGYMNSKIAKIGESSLRGLTAGIFSALAISIMNAIIMKSVAGNFYPIEIYVYFILLSGLACYTSERVRMLLEELSNENSNKDNLRIIKAYRRKGKKKEKKSEQKDIVVSFLQIGGLTNVKNFIINKIVLPIAKDGVLDKTLPKVILLYGPPGCGKTMLLLAIKNSLRKNSKYIDCSKLSSPKKFRKILLKVLSKLDKIGPMVLLLDNIETIINNKMDREFYNLIKEFRDRDFIVIAASNNTGIINSSMIRMLGHNCKIIHIPLPSEEERKEIFSIYLRDKVVDKTVDLNQLAKLTEGFSGRDIANICKKVFSKMRQLPIKRKKPVTIDEFIRVIEKYKPQAEIEENESLSENVLDNLIIKKKVTLDDIVNMVDIKRELLENIELPLCYPELLDKYKIKDYPKAIMLFGPKGCGKTLIIEALANQLNINFIRINCDELSTFSNALELLKENIENAMSKEPSLILLDRIEFIATEGKENKKFIDYLIKVFERIYEEKRRVIIVVTTSKPLHLDKRLFGKKRIEKFIFVPPPNDLAREEFIKRYFSNILEPNADISKLVLLTDGLSYFDLHLIYRKAKNYVLREKRKYIPIKALEQIIKTHTPSITETEISECIEFLTRMKVIAIENTSYR